MLKVTEGLDPRPEGGDAEGLAAETRGVGLGVPEGVAVALERGLVGVAPVDIAEDPCSLLVSPDGSWVPSKVVPPDVSEKVGVGVERPSGGSVEPVLWSAAVLVCVLGPPSPAVLGAPLK